MMVLLAKGMLHPMLTRVYFGTLQSIGGGLIQSLIDRGRLALRFGRFKAMA